LDSNLKGRRWPEHSFPDAELPVRAKLNAPVGTGCFTCSFVTVTDLREKRIEVFYPGAI